MTNVPSEPRARGFTLVELMVSMTLMAMVSAILFSLLSESQSIWLRSGKRIEAYREARVAFESISRDLSQAALHPYWDYDNANNPKDYVRRSELRFVSGPELLGTSSTEPVRGITHGIFFQAPLGHTSRADYQGLETMFNSCGYFIEFGDDASYRPDFLASRIEPKRRFRLMQWVQPAEQWDLFSRTSGNPGYNDRAWFSTHTGGSTVNNIHVLAENVIALVLLPRLPGTEDPDGFSLAPDYTYDSAPSTWPPPTPQPETENRLPPFVQVTLVTLDEGSAARLAEITDDPVGHLDLAALFRDARNFEDDLQALEETLQENRLEYRVFQSAVPAQKPMIAKPKGRPIRSRFRFGKCRGLRQRGAALILTLGILAILVLLVISYLSLAATEGRSARGYADGQSVKRLADSVTNIVMSQLREATEGFAKDGSGNLDPSSPLAWATQPGMAHTFTEGGSPDRAFKLYSSDRMVVARASAETIDESADMAGWQNQPGVFTDLNSPVMVKGGDGTLTPQSPIIDVDGLVDGTSLSPPVAGLTYSSDGTKADIEGFSIIPPASYRPGDPVSPTNNPAPMPVRWLYVLEDGQLTAPRHDAGDGTAVFDLPGQVEPTADNPIVARVAFWTDDECAKVNVNTASEGVYWDMPRTYSLQDVGQYNGNNQIPLHGGLSICQPAQKEFQRYPGHPATTSLSPVLESILPLPPEPVNNADSIAFDAYYELTPRTNNGGSQAGTAIPASTLPVRSDRLFPSVSDFLFSTVVAGRRGSPVKQRVLNGALNPDFVRRSEFFLSAHSKAPETTLFNTPRVTIWPIWEDPAKRTAYDKLAAFCSTIGDQPYFFARKNSRSGTDDFTARNQQIYGWLQRLTSSDVPAYGGNFATKYGADRDQILTYIFDYIRSTNTQDRSTGAMPYTPIFNSVGGSPRGAGEVVPIQIGDTQGFGRFPTLSEPGIMFVGTGGEPGRATEMEAVFAAEFFSPGHGMACVRHDMKYRVTGLDKMRVRFEGGEWESLNLPETGDCFIEQTDLTYWGGRGVGGTTGLPMIFQPNKNFTTSGGTVRGNFPFFSSAPIAIPDDDTIETMEFDGGDELVLEMRTGDTDELVQTSRFEFPDGEFKIPGFRVNIRSRNKGWPGEFPRPEDTFVTLEAAGAIGNAPEEALDPTAGDVRLLAGLREVPATRFRAHNEYTEPGVQFAHSTKTASGRTAINGTTHGQLVPVFNYECMRSGGTTYDRNPDVPSRVGTAVKRVDGMPGEWDTGFGDQPDGPYINKPNEGDTSYFNQQGSAYRAPYILGHNQGFISANQIFFSPNLQIPSPLMFGSIPSGVVRNRPWETLLFHPRPEDPAHPGRLTPHDHLLADLFWMPVIEPYAISQPFATAGKVNLNYRIQPFDFIRRETGMRAVMKGTKFLALHPTDSTKYKPLDPAQHGIPFAPDRRFDIDPVVTLSEFDSRYESAGVFRSPGEICEMHLIPEGESASSMKTFWETYSLSGDNVREKPYVDIYPRVTTRSNSFTIHFKVQVLKQARSTPDDVFDPKRDTVVAEQRGATVIERHIDPNDPRLPDFATLPPGSPEAVIDRYYRFRVLSSKTFKPGPAR